MTYAAKLKDPRWRALRATILIRDGNKCQTCGSKSDLQVHHKKYTGEPWEAPESDLITLCESCHKKAHEKVLIPSTALILFQHGFGLASRKLGEVTSTFNELLSRMDKPNVVYIRAALLVKTLGKSRSTIERHLAKIKELHIIRPDPIEEDYKIGQLCWRLCPFIAWRGTNDELKKYIEALPENDPWFEFREPT